MPAGSQWHSHSDTGPGRAPTGCRSSGPGTGSTGPWPVHAQGRGVRGGGKVGGHMTMTRRSEGLLDVSLWRLESAFPLLSNPLMWLWRLELPPSFYAPVLATLPPLFICVCDLPPPRGSSPAIACPRPTALCLRPPRCLACAAACAGPGNGTRTSPVAQERG